MKNTESQYKKINKICRLFINKMKDYGSAWRILRPSLLTRYISKLKEFSIQTLIKEN